MKIIDKEDGKAITFSTIGCLTIMILAGVCIGITAGVAVAVFKLIAG